MNPFQPPDVQTAVTAQIVYDAAMLRGIAEAARKMPLVVRCGQCAVCGRESLVIDRIDSIELVEFRCVKRCPHCEVSTLMLEAS